MRLSAQPLLNFQNINSFSYGNQWTVSPGDTNTLYFQLFDLEKGPVQAIGNLYPLFGAAQNVLTGELGLRYIAGVGVANQPTAIQVTFPSIDTTKVLNLLATQDPSDGSVWSVTIPSNVTPNSGNVQFALMEGSATRRFNILNMISVLFSNCGSDGNIPSSPGSYPY